MLFYIIRMIFFCAVLAVLIFTVRRSHIKNKQLGNIISFAVSAVLTTVFALIPVENAFVSFSSSENAYKYNHSADVKLTVNGGQSDFVTGEKNGANVYAIIPKSDGAFKIGMGTDIQRVSQISCKSSSVTIYKYKDTDDFYIAVAGADSGELNVSDNRGSEFKVLKEYHSSLNEPFYTYFAYVNSLDDGYVLTVDGEPIKV